MVKLSALPKAGKAQRKQKMLTKSDILCKIKSKIPGMYLATVDTWAADVLWMEYDVELFC